MVTAEMPFIAITYSQNKGVLDYLRCEASTLTLDEGLPREKDSIHVDKYVYSSSKIIQDARKILHDCRGGKIMKEFEQIDDGASTTTAGASEAVRMMLTHVTAVTTSRSVARWQLTLTPLPRVRGIAPARTKNGRGDCFGW
ncbi:hypothetical protein EVAR_36555_1 [Eumeta japonica]|uniref:Uncharacterized protein n=1 Tax=Eumeta variegata TaxID=151549 RepID=A0A4C1Y076_EUMVA|nr:hypothetical protein EVAR_36555_1 [Eumeta japonica]